VCPMQKEHHGREYVVTAIGVIGEYLALRYVIAWLGWLAALLLWAAFVEYTRKWASTRRWVYALWALAAVLIGGSTYCLMRIRVAQPVEAKSSPQQAAPQQTIGSRSPNSVQVGGGVDQKSKGDCAPNIIGGQNTVNCAPNNLRALKPAKLPDPPIPPKLAEDMKSWGVSIPPDAFKVYFGDSIGFTTKLQDMVVLRVEGKDLLAIHRSTAGITIDAKIFDSDGKIVVGIDHNIVRPNTNNIYYVEYPDPSTVIVHDQRDEVVLQVRYVNPRCVRVNGVFRYGGSVPVTITDNGIQWQGGVVSSNLVGNVGVFLSL
jgi:hypothetical protein